MGDEPLRLELLGPGRADVYVSGGDDDDATWQLVRVLDAGAAWAVSAPAATASDDEAVRRVMATCAGLVAVLPVRESEPGGTDPAVLADVRRAADRGLAVAVLAAPGVRVGTVGSALRVGATDPIPVAPGAAIRVLDDADAAGGWLDALVRGDAPKREPRRPFAFFVGRLERDFHHARQAVRVAVEREAGIACLWSDDGSHRLDVASVRERTRLLIRDACFVIADLTLGPESPHQENPSRAHEIGMALAYERPVMLCSQEPRRYPYFSIGDMQMTFWDTEAELSSSVATWIRSTPGVFARRVRNHELDRGESPRLATPEFHFDPAHQFVGPTRRRRRWRGARS